MQQAAVLQNNGQYIGLAHDEVFLAVEFEFGASVFSIQHFVAKYFDNSIREDKVLTIPFGGIIFTPGSAGTVQEVFQDAVQNHYLTYGFSSPMIFLGVEFWTKDLPVYSLLKDMMEAGRYKNLLLTLTDDSNEVMKVLQADHN